MKAFSPMEDLAKSIPWVLELPNLVRFIGAAELLGALGLIVPAATRIRPGLTPVATAGLAVIMVLAMGFHASRGEWSAIPVNLVLLALAVFVIWGRTRARPIRPRP